MVTKVRVVGKVIGLDYSTPAWGSAVVTPSVPLIRDTVGSLLMVGSDIRDFDSTGAFAFDLIATDDPDLDPRNFQYTIVLFLRVTGKFAEITFDLPASSGPQIDIEDLVQVDPAAPSYIEQVNAAKQYADAAAASAQEAANSVESPISLVLLYENAAT